MSIERRSIMSLPYDHLDMAARCNAIRDAQIAGDRFAAEDEDGPFTDRGRAMRAHPTDYFHAVIEPAWHADEISAEMYYAWRHELVRDKSVADPRVAAFVAAANERYASDAAEMYYAWRNE